MDPNHWNSLNPQLVSRLGAGNVPVNPSVPLLEHHGLAAPGISGLPTPIPTPTAFPVMPHISYSHAFPGSAMTQILDSLAVGQSQYKTVAVGRPAYSLVDSSSRATSDTAAAAAAMYAAQSKVSLFNTDPHTMSESGHSPSHTTPSPVMETEPTRSWSHSTYQPPSSVFSAPSASSTQISTPQEPPPAHTGHGRLNNTPKFGFQNNLQTDTTPRQAHSNFSSTALARSQMLGEMLKGPYTSQQAPPQAHSMYDNDGRSTTQRAVYEDPRQHSDPYRRLTQNTAESSPPVNQHVQPTQAASQVRTSPVVRSTPAPAPVQPQVPKPYSSSYNNTPVSTYNPPPPLTHVNYDPISPAAPTQAPAPVPNSQCNSGMPLQGFPNMNSNQEKNTMANNSMAQSRPAEIPQQAPTIGAMNMLGNNPGPGTNNILPGQNNSIPAPHPVQAVADSTTKPKRGSRKSSGSKAKNPGGGGRGKKKNDTPDPVPPSHGVSPMPISIPGSSMSSFQSMTSIQPHYSAVSEAFHQLHQGSYGTIADQIGLSHVMGNSEMVPPHMAAAHHVMEQLAPSKPQPVFLTNTFGNSFVNPAIDTADVDIRVVDGDTCDNDNPLVDTRMQDSMYYNKHGYPRTKAEQKQMPIDDEFSHLDAGSNQNDQYSPNKCSKSKNLPNHQTGNPHGRPHINPQCKPPGNPQDEPSNEQPSNETAPPNKKPDGFQSSFLSFLQGKKQETLSSVTNSAITSKPKLPKYCPEAFPKPRPAPQPTQTETEKESPNKAPGFQTAPKNIGKTSTSIIKTNSSKVAEIKNNAAAQIVNRSPTLKVVLNKTSAGPQTVVKTGSTPQGSSSRVSSVPTTPIGRPKTKVKKPTPTLNRTATGEFLPRSLTLEEEALPPREKSSRKAKDKVEEKKKAKKKKRKKDYSDDSGSDPDYMELSSNSEPETRDYDSDKDPVWTPFAQDVGATKHDSDDENESRRKARKALSARKPPPSKQSRRGSVSDRAHAELLASAKPHAISQEILEFLSDDEEPPHLYQKGSFVIDRRDLAKYDSFPIWKVDAGRLLQKFECVVRDGKILHKSLSTYSSWTDNIRERYKAIKAKWLEKGPDRTEDLVEVDPESLPQPVDDSIEEDTVMQAFNVYVQILVSQALEPGFLSAIQSEKDEYYVRPTQEIDGLLSQKKEQIAAKVKWTANLQESVENYPYLFMGDKGEQTTSDKPILKSIQLSGESYIRDTLEDQATTLTEDNKVNRPTKEFLIGHVTAQFIQVYHSLHHYKYILHKRCRSKVILLRGNSNKDQSDILDQCLQNRVWVHKLFKNFHKLLKRADEVLTSGLAAKPESVPSLGDGGVLSDPVPTVIASTASDTPSSMQTS